MAQSKLKTKNLKLKTTRSKTIAQVVKKSKAEGRTVKGVKTEKLSVPVYGVDGKEVGKVDLPSEIFGVKENKALIAQAVRVYLANQRAGSASVKTRGEVKGSTRKIYRQKGTGRARHGARYAPIFVGGGVAHGPTLRDFSLKMPKRMKRLSLFSSLSSKLADKKVRVVESVDKIEPKTKKAVAFLKVLGLIDKRGKTDKLLIVLPSRIEGFEKAASNIVGLTLEKAANLNTYEVLNSRHIVLLKDSIGVLKKTFLEDQSIRQAQD